MNTRKMTEQEIEDFLQAQIQAARSRNGWNTIKINTPRFTVTTEVNRHFDIESNDIHVWFSNCEYGVFDNRAAAERNAPARARVERAIDITVNGNTSLLIPVTEVVF
jgi:hypothetical protein